MTSRLPSLDDYDVQGIRPSEAAWWPDDIRYAVDDLTDVYRIVIVPLVDD
ncbi:hypothetical protein [Streptomyces sp. NPDC058280]